MADGKYVRAPQYDSDSEDNNSYESDVQPHDPASMSESDYQESVSSGSQHSLVDPHASVSDDDDNASKDDSDHCQPHPRDGIEVDDSEEPTSNTESLVRRPPEENAELYKRMDQFEKMLNNLASVYTTKQRDYHVPSEDDVEESWSSARSAVPQDAPMQSIRWDHIKAFPKGIPANKMWEAWHKYIETFEIAASLGNAFDPPRRAQLLFLSVGEEMQAIIRAAKLRPSLSEPDCYAKFVRNIDQHLRTVTDTSAEHKAFSNMHQGMDETVMNFHARLVEKVKLCGYSAADQERFVRAQLIKGMSNQALAKSARTMVMRQIMLSSLQLVTRPTTEMQVLLIRPVLSHWKAAVRGTVQATAKTRNQKPSTDDQTMRHVTHDNPKTIVTKIHMLLGAERCVPDAVTCLIVIVTSAPLFLDIATRVE